MPRPRGPGGTSRAIRGTVAPGGSLRRQHVVTVDAGHGGVDPGNPGVFFPAGLKEKDVTLQMSLLLREELRPAASPCA